MFWMDVFDESDDLLWSTSESAFSLSSSESSFSSRSVEAREGDLDGDLVMTWFFSGE